MSSAGTFRMMGSIYVVRGNNDKDWAEGIAKTLYFTIEGVKFFMTHNKKDVDWDLKDTQIVIFGHTHKYFEKIIDNRLWLNPGMRRAIIQESWQPFPTDKFHYRLSLLSW